MNGDARDLVDIGGKLWDFTTNTWVRACLGCGRLHHTKRADVLYCSNACKTRFKRHTDQYTGYLSRAARENRCDELTKQLVEDQSELILR